MQLSQFFLPTIKETPADSELISHRLMLRAGMIRQLAAGIYTWLPLGFRVLKKIEIIVREEMNRAGALEILMPAVQPSELWIESERWQKYGNELLKIKDRNKREFCFGPTHEEVITDLARREIRSYKQLPLTLYQIQTKFRDEIRPRFGVMRAREFLMKDAYSFHLDEESLKETYFKIAEAYQKIFERLQLKFRMVLADTGSIGGKYSHEFQVLAESGEDVIVYSDESDYAANLERATALPSQEEKDTAPLKLLEKIPTPGLKTIKELEVVLQLPANQSVKTLIVRGSESPMVALILRGDHQLNEIKAGHVPGIASPLTFIDEKEIRNEIGAGPGSLGPVGLQIPVIVDPEAANLVNFTCGANEDDYHLINVNWDRDTPLLEVHDLRLVEEGDKSPDGCGNLKFARGIEVGHIFQLGDRYSSALNATVLNDVGKSVPIIMGSYGIGISRIVAAAIEQNHDERGIVWPQALAPFDVALIPMQMHKSYRTKALAEELYQTLQQAGFSVLFDDRKERPGVMFADMDLIGIPNRIVVSERGIDQNTVEYKSRTGEQTEDWQIPSIIEKLLERSKK